MQTQTNGKGNGTGIGKGFPKSDANPTGYTNDERARKLEGKKKAGVGRKDGDGIKAIVKIESLQIKVPHLTKLLTDAESAATDWKEAVNAVAEESGLNAATVAKYIKARAGDKFDETKQRILQMALVFEEVA